jgi:hypothetical protein
MRKFVLLILFLSPCVVYGQSYSSDFPMTENPISLGGHWLNGGSIGIRWNNIATVRGFAFGNASNITSFCDPTAALTGTWAAN